MSNLMVLDRKGDSVRYIYKDGMVLFSANDVVSMSGIKAARKWVARDKEIHKNDFQMVKVSQITKAGKRTFWMSFCDLKVCMRIFEETPCEQSVRKWFLNEAQFLQNSKEEPYISENSDSKIKEKMLLKTIDEIILALATIKAQMQ